MDGNPDAAVERGEDLPQSVQREPTEARVADAREIRCGKTGDVFGLADRELALIQHGDDSGRNDCLGLPQVRKRIAEVAEDIPAPPRPSACDMLANLPTFRQLDVANRFERSLRPIVLAWSQHPGKPRLAYTHDQERSGRYCRHPQGARETQRPLDGTGSPRAAGRVHRRAPVGARTEREQLGGADTAADGRRDWSLDGDRPVVSAPPIPTSARISCSARRASSKRHAPSSACSTKAQASQAPAQPTPSIQPNGDRHAPTGDKPPTAQAARTRPAARCRGARRSPGPRRWPRRTAGRRCPRR